MHKDPLGDRIKRYEHQETGRSLMPLLPVVARLDGRSFSRFTQGLQRPFDPRMSDLMLEVARFLVEDTGACYGYTQSDEISLVFYSPSHDEQIFFNGRIFKMTSNLAALATAKFNRLLPEYLPEKAHRLPTFDCRVFNLPNLMEAANTILWREFDATKNSIYAVARTFYSHDQLDGLTIQEMHDRLFERGINWNDYEPRFKRGSHIQRRHVERAFTAEEIDLLPPKHAAHKNPSLTVLRSTITVLPMPPFSKVLNRVEVIFSAADPLVGSDVSEAPATPDVEDSALQAERIRFETP